MDKQITPGTILKVLSLEDSQRDFEIISESLIKAGFDLNIIRVEKKNEFESLLRNNVYDIILADFKLPGFDAFGALTSSQKICPETPFICISGSIGEEMAVELMKLGAVDYILKDRLERLPLAVKAAIISTREKAELKQMQEKLKLASENWSSTFNSIQDGIILMNANQEIIEVNQAFLNFIGKTREETLGQHCWPFVHNTACPVDGCPFVKSKTSRKREIMEMKIGESEYEVMVDPIIDENNHLTGAVHIVTDITERKLIEKNLEKNYRELAILNQFSVKLAMLSSEDNLEATIIKSLKEITGAETVVYSDYNPVDRTTIVKEIEMEAGILEKVVGLLGNKLKNMQSPVSDEMYLEMTTDIIGVKKSLHEATFGFIPRPVSSAMQALLKIDRYIGLAFMLEGVLYGTSLLALKKDQADISREILENIVNLAAVSLRRKKAEEALKKSESSLHYAQEIAKMGSWKQNLITQKAEWSENSFKMFGYKPYEFEPTFDHFKKSIHPDDFHIIEKAFSDMSKNRTEHKSEMRIVLPDGNIKWLQTNMVPVFKDNTLVELIGTNIDITERKQAENLIKQSESSLNYAQEISKMGSWEWDVLQKKVEWSPNYYRVFGINPSTVVPALDSFRVQIYPDDVAFFDEIYALIFKEQKSQNFELRIVQPDGDVKWIQNYVVPFVEDGKIVKLKGAFIDITELKEAEKMTHDIIEKNPMSIQIVDKGGYTLKVNPAHTKLFGAVPPPNFSLFSDSQLNLQGLTEEFKKLKKGEVINFPDSSFNPHDLNPAFPDTEIWLRATAFPLFENKKDAEQYVIMHENITEHKKYEIALKESEEKYRAIFDNVQDVFYQTDLEGIVHEISPSIKYFTEFTSEEIIGKPVHWLYYNPEDRELLVNELLKKGELKDYELALKPSKGGKIMVSINARLIMDAQGKPHHIDGALRDISARKHAEEKLEKTHKKYLELVDSISDVFFSMDKDLRYTYWNKASEKLTGVSAENAIGKTLMEVIPENESRQQLIEFYSQVIDSKKPQNLTVNYLGDEFLVHEITAYPTVEGVSAFVKDITESKTHELAIIESKKTAERYLNIAAELIMSLDTKGNIIMVNESGLKLLGYQQDEIIGKNWFKTCIPKGYSSEIAGLFDRIMAGEDFEPLENNENHIITKSGEIKTIFFYNNLLIDADGKITGLICSGSDITESKKAEAAIRESEERFRKIFEESQIGMIIANLNLRFEKVNPAFCKMLGYTIEELTSMNFKKITHPDDIDIGLEHAKKLELGEISFYKAEKRYMTKSGDFIWGNIVVTNVRDKDGKPLYYLTMIEDVTERRRAEEKLQASKDYLDKIINTVAYPIFVRDEEYKFYLVNNALCEMYGHTKEEILGKTDFDFFPEELAKGSQVRDKEVMLSGKENKNEEVLTDATGNIRTLITTKTLYTDNNRKKYIVGIINDISQRKQMELELVKAKDRAEESDRLKSAFLANMSHEIRTPMNGILGFAELLKEPNLKSEKQQEFIGIIEKSGIRLLNIINNLVNISKIESGLMNTYVSELNVNDQIEYIYNFFKPEIEKKGMQFFTKMGLSSKEALVTSDREKIIAILTNLVGNAIKFTDKGSIELGYVKKANRLEFYIKDTGRGIRQEQKEFIFERFRQGSESLSRNYEGAGLGLSISKSYVEMLGGKMWVESEEGNGSTFYFTIPYEAGLEEKEIVVISKPAVRDGINIQNKNLKVLIAEDDDISLFLVTLEVKVFAKEIYTATSGTEAVKICRNNSDIDLVLMDIKMQEMDGYEATRQIRQFNKEVIIIAQTAFGLVGDREKAIAAGCNNYISKPLDLYRLKELITTYFK